MKSKPCILCMPINLLIKPYRQLSAYLTSLSFHAYGFRFVAKIGPAVWLVLIPLLFAVYGVWIWDGVASTGLKVACIAPGMAVAYWLTLFWCVTPDPSNPGILCNVKPGRVMSVHLERDVSKIDFEKGTSSALVLAREIGARHIDLYSPLFGRAEKEKVWLNKLHNHIKRLAPGATLDVAHRDPLNRYVAFAYRCQYGENARAFVKDGRVQAACFRITGF